MKYVVLASLLFFTACAPSYTGTRGENAVQLPVTGVYIGTFFGAGELDYTVLNELPRAIGSAGFKVTNVKYPDPKGASIKIEGDTVAARTNDPRPSRLEAAEVRVIEFKTGRTLIQYRFRAGNLLEERTPSQFANDVAAMLKREFKQQP
jgi:hypothetical protein